MGKAMYHEFSFETEQVMYLSKGIGWLFSHAFASAGKIGILPEECEQLQDVITLKSELDSIINELAQGVVSAS